MKKLPLLAEGYSVMRTLMWKATHEVRVIDNDRRAARYRRDLDRAIVQYQDAQERAMQALLSAEATATVRAKRR